MFPRHRAVAALAAFGFGACSTASDSCVTTSTGFVTCANYAEAYPADYTAVDPAAAYTVDTVPADIAFAIGVGLFPSDAGRDGGTAAAARFPELVTLARSAASGINDGVRLAIDPILALLRTTPAQASDTLTYGPLVLGNASYVFKMRQFSTAQRRYGWRLDAAPAGRSTYALVAGGNIQVGDVPRRGIGAMAIDGDALAVADSSLHSAGKLLLGFADTATTKLLRFALDAYSSDTAVRAPLTAAAIAYTQDRTSVAVRIATVANLAESPTSSLETVVIKLHWLKNVGARADALATGGDVPANTALLVSSCVPPSLDRADTPTTVSACTMAGANCTQISGPNPLTCPNGLPELDLPDADPAVIDPPAALPALPAVPTGIVDGTQG